ncbi:MAG: phosphotransferase [Myxococcota bacterium]
MAGQGTPPDAARANPRDPIPGAPTGSPTGPAADSIPDRAEAIDAAWLEAALRERHPGVRVESVEVADRAEVTNNHAWLRVRLAEPAGVPESLFCKLLPVEPARRAAIAATGMGLREARFYAELAPLLKLRVPRAFVARSDAGDGRFVLLLEDLRLAGCTVSSGPESVPPDAAADALADLADLHVRYEDPGRRAREAGFVKPPDPPSDYGSTRLAFALARRRDGFGEAFAEASRLYVDHQPALHALWAAGPSTVIHGDTHIGNLFFDPAGAAAPESARVASAAVGRVGFLDWGMLVVSTPLRDVAYFLQMALSVEDRRREERRLLDHYLAVRRALGGSGIDRDEAFRAYRIQAAYLAPASCQVVTLPDDATPARRRFAAAFLQRAEAAIEDLEACRAVHEAAGI